jgi:ribose/xylose/arabinose/galactoside ABC-type transport system permease subunit
MIESSSTPGSGAKPKRHFLRAAMEAREVTILLFIVAAAVFIGLRADSFFTAVNLSNLVKQIAVNGILSIGMMMSIISQGVDLSIGSILGLLCAVAGKCVDGGMSMLIAAPLVLAIGALCGYVNGLLIVKLRVAPIIVTLGMMNIFRGIAHVYSGGKWQTGLPEGYIALGQGYMPAVLFAAAAAVFVLVMGHTRFGRHVYAIGSNEESARLAGIRVDRTKKAIYALSGLLVGLATLVFIGRTGAIQPSAGAGYEMNAIGATVLGGVSFAGGKGSVAGTLLGVVLMGLLMNGMTLLKISANYQGLVKGLVIIIALLLDVARNAYGEKRQTA